MNHNLRKTKHSLMAIALFSLIFSCKKNVDYQQTVKPDAPKDYLVLKNGEELNTLISQVSKMSDNAYDQWKKANHLNTTLYDKFVLTAHDLEQLKNSTIDTNYFYIKNNILYSKNGILFDKILNQHGVIQIGKYLLRYENNNVFYIDEDKQDAGAINKNDAINHLQTSLKKTTPINEAQAKELPRSNSAQTIMSLRPSTIMEGIDHRTGTPQPGQQFNYELKYQEDNIGPMYRYRTWLFENFIIYPTGNTGQNGLPLWNVAYRVYLQYGLQKNALVGWANAGCSVGLSYFHIESIIKNRPASNDPFEGFYYYPGKIQNPSEGANNPIQVNSTQFNFTDASGIGGGTTFGEYPTWEIYKTDANAPTTSEPNRDGVTYSVYIFTGRFKLNISHYREPRVGPSLGNRDFNYEFQ